MTIDLARLSAGVPVADLSAAAPTRPARWGRGWFAVGVAATIVAASTAWSWVRFAGGSLQGADFFSFYAAARLFLERGGRDLYDAGLQLRYQDQVTSVWPGKFTLLPYIHPPFYTLLIAPPSPLSFNHLLYRDPGYDPTRFVPITLLAKIANVLAVRKELPANTLAQLVDYGKAHPGRLSYASQGVGSTAHRREV